MKYLVVCDLDETLLTSNKKIKRKSIKYIRKFVETGNYFVLCTGRPFLGAIDYYEKLNIKMPFITDNGTSIYFPDGSGYKQITFGINLEIFKEFLNKIDKYIDCGISTNSFEINMQEKTKLPSWIIHTEGKRVIIKEGKLIDILDKDPILPNIWIKDENKDYVLKIYEDYKKYFNIRTWFHEKGYCNLEMFSVDASKGNAMNYLKNLYSIDKTISFGDELNDISMLKMADIGVVMINAKDSIKKEFKYITDYDCNHNGVVRYLNKIIK